MKRILAALACIAIVSVVAFAACHSGAHADEPDPPVQMAPVDAARLDAALSHMREIQAKAQVESAPYAKEATDILSRYKIDPRAFRDGQTVDYATGKIERAPVAAKR